MTTKVMSGLVIYCFQPKEVVNYKDYVNLKRVKKQGLETLKSIAKKMEKEVLKSKLPGDFGVNQKNGYYNTILVCLITQEVIETKYVTFLPQNYFKRKR